MSKTRRDCHVPISDDLAEVMRAQLAEGDGEHVFTNRDDRPWRNNLLKRFRTCVKAAQEAWRTWETEMGKDGEEPEAMKPRGLDLHSLRDTFGTLLAHNGVHPKIAQKLMGHATFEMTMDLYTQVYVQDERAAVNKLALGVKEGACHSLGTGSARVAATA